MVIIRFFFSLAIQLNASSCRGRLGRRFGVSRDARQRGERFFPSPPEDLDTYTPQSARLRARSEKLAEEGEDVSDSSEESEIEEELGFFSLIDAINPYTTFKHALTSA